MAEAKRARDEEELCSTCNNPVADDGKKRVKHRKRRCKNCRNEAVVTQRKNDPVKLVLHRLYNMLRRCYPDGAARALYSREVVARVLARWNSRSVIGGSTDINQLCIISYRKMENGAIPEENDLVVVTSDESHQIAKLDAALRLAKFPPEVQLRLNERI